MNIITLSRFVQFFPNLIGNRITNIELALENNVIPRLQNIESCYTSTYNRYRNDADKIESTCADVKLLKKIFTEILFTEFIFSKIRDGI